MALLETSSQDVGERRDVALEQAFLVATDNSISSPNTLQRALFPRLSSQDTGLLVQTGPGAGRLEAVFVPVVTGTNNGRHLQRLFIIAADDSLLDDYLYRLFPYVRSLAVNREQSVTIFVEGDVSICRQYLPDGSYLPDVCNHPLDFQIDLVVASFTRFRSLFFGAGGVHAIPGDLEGRSMVEFDMSANRRDLFYFDEAQSYDRDEFRGFVKLVEFLYAADMDVLVGTTTLPESLQDDLSFFEELAVKSAQYQPNRTIKFIPDDGMPFKSLATALVRERYFQNSRVGIVCESPGLAAECYAELSRLYPQGVYSYHSALRDDIRLMTYAQIRELEKEGEGYLLIADGTALANADLDVNILITAICAPEMLIRRAGRCNRHGDLRKGEIIVLGSGGYLGRRLPQSRLGGYLSSLELAKSESEFVADVWREFAA